MKNIPTCRAHMVLTTKEILFQTKAGNEMKRRLNGSELLDICRLMTKEKNGSQMSSSQMPHFSLKSLKGWPPRTVPTRIHYRSNLKYEVNSCEANMKWTQLVYRSIIYTNPTWHVNIQAHRPV